MKDALSKIFSQISLSLAEEYAGTHHIDSFSYDVMEREDGHTVFHDMNIAAETTLIRGSEENPFIQGMEEALQCTDNESGKRAIRNKIDFYSENISSQLNSPTHSLFEFSIHFDYNFKARSYDPDSFTLYDRVDAAEEIVLVDAAVCKKEEDPTIEKLNGFLFGRSAATPQRRAAPVYAFAYDRLAARDWANANALAKPEYPSKQVAGTDCANFVSKALYAGGIPQDKSGKWYKASSWGGWPGDNWLRTGYYNNGGVVTYMRKKGYFYKESNTSKVFAGSIMYWNKTSHVALVTYGDGTLVKFAQHGATQSKDTVYRNQNASFYLPTPSMMK
jgi:hypothetical protein